MRAPSSTLVLDAAVLVAAVRGRSSGAVMAAARAASLVTTDRVVREARRRIELGLKRPDLLEILDALVAEVTVVPVTALANHLVAAEISLREAVPSRNGSIADAQILALAWGADAEIWTADRDFAGTGIASWSTPNLMRGLAGRLVDEGERADSR